MRRVVITGMGMVSPLGNSLPQSWSALIEGKTGIETYANDEILNNAVPYNLALIKDFPYSQWKTPHATSRMNSFVACSVDEALLSARMKEINPKRTGICMGIMSSNISKIEQFVKESSKNNYTNINRLSMMHILSNIPTGTLNVKYQIYGPSLTVSTACASGLSAIVEAYKWIKLNEADVAIAGGAEDVYNPICLNSSLRLQAMSSKMYNTPGQSSRPFDNDRSGFILGEGCGALIIEELEHAKRRGAKIFAEILAYGCTSDGYHLVRPRQSGEGQIQSMELALKKSQISLDKFSMVNTHATSTKAGDQIEANSIEKVFQNHKPFISAFKGSLGHTFGAAGALEAIFSVKCIQQSIIPKINNLSNPDVKGINYAMGENIKTEVNYVLKNSFGFGGINVSMVFGKYQE